MQELLYNCGIVVKPEDPIEFANALIKLSNEELLVKKLEKILIKFLKKILKDAIKKFEKFIVNEYSNFKEKKFYRIKNFFY